MRSYDLAKSARGKATPMTMRAAFERAFGASERDADGWLVFRGSTALKEVRARLEGGRLIVATVGDHTAPDVPVAIGTFRDFVNSFTGTTSEERKKLWLKRGESEPATGALTFRPREAPPARSVPVQAVPSAPDVTHSLVVAEAQALCATPNLRARREMETLIVRVRTGDARATGDLRAQLLLVRDLLARQDSLRRELAGVGERRRKLVKRLTEGDISDATFQDARREMLAEEFDLLEAFGRVSDELFIEEYEKPI